MATTGEVLPTSGTTTSEAPWSDNTWVAPENVTADDATYASVTAGTFDATDQTFVLKAFGFDFSGIPDGSTINGVTARVEARADSTSVFIDLAQLLDVSGAKVGDNLALAPSLDIALTTSDTVYTIGGASSLWGNALTAAWVKDAEFGIALGARADVANSQVFIDYVTLEIDYSNPNATATPSVVSGTASIAAPTVQAGATATPNAAAGSTTIPTPTVTTAGGDATATPVVVAGTAAVGSANASASSTATPTVLAGTAAVGAPTASASSTATPTVVAGMATAPAPSASSSSTATPSVVAGPATVASPTASASSTVTLTVVVGATTIPTPSVQTGGDANVAPATVAATTTVGAPAISTGSAVTATVVAGTAAIAAPTPQAGAVVTLTTVNGVAAIATPTIGTGGGATATPATVMALTSVPSPTIPTLRPYSGVTPQLDDNLTLRPVTTITGRP